jgi:hypothetical protein
VAGRDLVRLKVRVLRACTIRIWNFIWLGLKCFVSCFTADLCLFCYVGGFVFSHIVDGS